MRICPNFFSHRRSRDHDPHYHTVHSRVEHCLLSNCPVCVAHLLFATSSSSTFPRSTTKWVDRVGIPEYLKKNSKHWPFTLTVSESKLCPWLFVEFVLGHAHYCATPLVVNVRHLLFDLFFLVGHFRLLPEREGRKKEREKERKKIILTQPQHLHVRQPSSSSAEPRARE